MIILVKLSPVIIDRHPGLTTGEPIKVHLPNGADVSDLLQSLDLSKPGEAVVIMNGKVQQPGRVLNNGNCVTILPVVEGG